MLFIERIKQQTRNVSCHIVILADIVNLISNLIRALILIATLESSVLRMATECSYFLSALTRDLDNPEARAQSI